MGLAAEVGLEEHRAEERQCHKACGAVYLERNYFDELPNLEQECKINK